MLSDPRRRERYDNGEDEDGATDGMGGMGGMPMDLSELFAQFHGSGFGGGGFSSFPHEGGFGGGARTRGFPF